MEKLSKSKIEVQVNQPGSDLTAQDFPTRLGQALIIWATGHPNPEEELEFIGSFGRITFTPTTFANEIVDKTPFGLERIDFYRGVSRNLGDDSGERIIQDLIHWWDTRTNP